MKYDYVYDSSVMRGEKEYSIEKVHSDSLTQPIYVLFQQEGVYLAADASGNLRSAARMGLNCSGTKPMGKENAFSAFTARSVTGLSPSVSPSRK